MGRWLAKYSGDMPKSLLDIPDIVDKMGSVSGLSVPDWEVSAQNFPPQPANEPTPPHQPNWLVAYRDGRDTLCGGCDDREHGTVKDCRWEGNGWTVELTDGQRIPLCIVRGVTNLDGSACKVREHSYDGEG